MSDQTLAERFPYLEVGWWVLDNFGGYRFNKGPFDSEQDAIGYVEFEKKLWQGKIEYSAEVFEKREREVPTVG